MSYLLSVLFFSYMSFAGLTTKLAGPDIVNENHINWNWPEAKKATVVIFFSAICPCSNNHVDYLKKLRTDFADYDFFGVHSNIDENREIVVNYFKKQEINFKVISDKNSSIANHLGALRTPHAYLISKQGEILYQGGVTDSSDPLKAKEFHLFDALISHKNNKEIKIKKSRVLGCEIARN